MKGALGTVAVMGMLYYVAMGMALAIIAGIIATIVFVIVMIFVACMGYTRCFSEADERATGVITVAHVIGAIIAIVAVTSDPIKSSLQDYFSSNEPDMLYISFTSTFTVATYVAFALGLTKLISAGWLKSWFAILPAIGIVASITSALFLMTTSLTTTQAHAEQEQYKQERKADCRSGVGSVKATIRLTSTTDMTLAEVGYNVESAYERPASTFNGTYDKTFEYVRLPFETSTAFTGQYHCLSVYWGQSMAAAEQGNGGTITCTILINGKVVASNTSGEYSSGVGCSNVGADPK
jgi:hypothetical protein